MLVLGRVSISLLCCLAAWLSGIALGRRVEGTRNSDAKHQMLGPDVRHRMVGSDVKHQISSIRCQTLDVKHQMSGSDVRHQMLGSYVWLKVL